jgi:hypothetical protein
MPTVDSNRDGQDEEKAEGKVQNDELKKEHST